MPKVKKNTALVSEKKVVKKTKVKAKPVVKKIIPKKKAKPIIVDVIEDDEPEVFFPELETASEEMYVLDKLKVKKEMDPEIDQQKKFFSELVTEIKEKKSNPGKGKSRANLNDDEDKPRVNKSVGLYRRLVWRFIAFTVVLLLIVFYFSFSKLTIIISPKGEAINDSLLLKIQPAGTTAVNPDTDFREQVPGTVKELTLAEEKSFPASGEEITGDEVSGQVNIINNSPKSQALVTNTRILSPEGKLFRIKEAVNVPAGGEVTVAIYTEKPSEEFALSPTTFTIPGLWLGLQDKIYAKSTTAFVYQQKIKKYVKASDIDQATKEMSNLLVAKAKITAGAPDYNQISLYDTISPATFEISAKAGDAKDSFIVKAKGTMVAVTFSKDEAVKLATAKLALLIPDDKELVDYNPANINYTFDNYDLKTGIAAVKETFTGTMVLKNDSEIIDKKQLVNLNKQQLENYLKSFPEIKSYELKFYPSFISRAPRLPERIEIDVSGMLK